MTIRKHDGAIVPMRAAKNIGIGSLFSDRPVAIGGRTINVHSKPTDVMHVESNHHTLAAQTSFSQ